MSSWFMIRVPIILAAAILAMALVIPGSGYAQQAPQPPKYSAVDENGVNLVGGHMGVTEQVNTVGPENVGLYASRTFLGQTISHSHYAYAKLRQDNMTGLQYVSVSLFGASQEFQYQGDNGGQHIAIDGSPNTLVSVGTTLVYTLQDGTVAYYGTPPAGQTTTTSTNSDLQGYQDGSKSGAQPNRPICCLPWTARMLTKVVFPGGETLIFGLSGSQISVESSVGYGLAASFSGTNPQLLDFTAANLTQATCVPGSCSGSSGAIFTSAAGLGRARTLNVANGATVTLTNPTGTTRTYQISASDYGDIVTSYTDGKGTWSYAYAYAFDDYTGDVADGVVTITRTDPYNHTRIVKSRLSNGHIISDTNGVGQMTTFQYSGENGHPGRGYLNQITYPEGNKDRYEYDPSWNVTAAWKDAKPNSGFSSTVVRAGYPSSNCTPKNCNKPLWIQDERGNQTDLTYSPDHGGLLFMARPAGPNGVRPTVTNTYAQFTARYNRNGAMQAASTPVWRLVQSSSCRTQSSCVNTGDELRTTYAYENSANPNNVNLISMTRQAGDSSVVATTTYTSSPRGDIASADGPAPGSADTSTFWLNGMRWKQGEIGPDPDGSGPLQYDGVKRGFRADGTVMAEWKGRESNTDFNSFSAFQAIETTTSSFDAQDRLSTQTVTGPSNEVISVTQRSYSNDGQLLCEAVRMNMSQANGDACTLMPQGAFGPDRITRYAYDNAGRLTSATAGYGTSTTKTESTTYTPNGKTQTVTDGNSNLTTIYYDGLDRPAVTYFPNPSGGGSNPNDYETYGYDASGNRTSLRRRSGHVLTYAYDALGRRSSQTDPLGVRSIAYAYDNADHMISASGGGPTVTMNYDALGRRTSESSALGTMASQFDASGRRTRLTWPDGFSEGYQYDNANQVNAMVEGPTNATLIIPQYDDLGRRSVLLRANLAQTYYSYDGGSRLTGLNLSRPDINSLDTFTFGVNAASEIVSRTASNGAYEFAQGYTVTTAYTHDGLNQMTSAGGSPITYNARGDIKTAAGVTYNYDLEDHVTSTAAGAAAEFDSLGRLYSVASPGVARVRFVYDGQEVASEYDDGGTVLRRYARGDRPDEIWSLYEGSWNGDRRYPIADERGSIISVTNGSGAPMVYNTYDEYGVPATTNQGRFQFTGQLWWSALGLYHYKARTYSPTLGRFLQIDPIGNKDDRNLFAYVKDDPINQSDPTGTEGEAGCVSNGGTCGLSPNAIKEMQDHPVSFALGTAAFIGPFAFAGAPAAGIAVSTIIDSVTAQVGAGGVASAMKNAGEMRADLAMAAQRIINVGKNNAMAKDFRGVANEVAGKNTGFNHVKEMSQSVQSLNKSSRIISKGLSDTRTPEAARGGLTNAKIYADKLAATMRTYLDGR